jgi:hypothetical protein
MYKKERAGLSLQHTALYMRLKAEADRLGHLGIKQQVAGLEGETRSRLSRALFKLTEIRMDLQDYNLDEVEL